MRRRMTASWALDAATGAPANATWHMDGEGEGDAPPSVHAHALNRSITLSYGTRVVAVAVTVTPVCVERERGNLMQWAYIVGGIYQYNQWMVIACSRYTLSATMIWHIDGPIRVTKLRSFENLKKPRESSENELHFSYSALFFSTLICLLTGQSKRIFS